MKKVVFLLVSIVLISCETQKSDLKILEGNAIGTTFSIRYLDSHHISFEEKIDSLIKAINKSVSTYIPTSDISKINKGDTTVVIDAYFEEIFMKSKKIYDETNGAFDPTIGILVNAWGFGPEKAVENLDSVKIAALLNFVGLDKISIRDKKVKKLYPKIYIDFNAIAKGYLIDVIGRMFEAHEIENYMVEIGGEIRGRGVNQNNVPWKIAVENPNFDGSRSFATTIQLQNESMATSGNYRKFRTSDDGRKYVHTINTKTGFALESNLLSASVISKSDCADVDAYATAFMVMGLEETIKFLEVHTELKAFLIYADESGELKTFNSKNLVK